MRFPFPWAENFYLAEETRWERVRPHGSRNFHWKDNLMDGISLVKLPLSLSIGIESPSYGMPS